MNNKKLILTGLSDLWPENERDALFLGPWCFSNNINHKFSEYPKFNVLPSGWENWEEVYEASRYIEDLFDRLLPTLVEVLNFVYDQSYSDKFWRIALINYYIHWLGIMYDRFKTINATQAFGYKLDVNIISNPFQIILEDCDDLNKLLNSHSYNLCLYSQILLVGKFSWLNSIPVSVNVSRKFHKTEEDKLKISKYIKKLIKGKITHYLLPNDIHIGKVYGLDKYDCKILRTARYGKRLKFISTDEILPKNRLSQFGEIKFVARNLFEDIVRELLIKCLPSKITESIPALDELECVRYWLGNDIYDQRKAYKIARIVENGGKWIDSQHGAGYFQLYSLPCEKIEYETSDWFISWGGIKQIYKKAKIIPLPSPMLSKLKNKIQKLRKTEDGKKIIVFAAVMVPSYYYKLASFFLPSSIIKYTNDKIDMFKNIDEQCLRMIRYKPYFDDYGIDQVDYIANYIPKENIISASECLTDYFSTCRLLIVDYIGTCFLEAMAANVPVLLYINNEVTKINSEFESDCKLLKCVNIYFDSPFTLANHLNNVYVKIDEWWFSETVQKCRIEFNNKYARNSDNYISDWVKFVKELP